MKDPKDRLLPLSDHGSSDFKLIKEGKDPSANSESQQTQSQIDPEHNFKSVANSIWGMINFFD